MSERGLSFNKLNVAESLEDLSDNIKQMHVTVTEVEKLKRRVGTITDNEELWCSLTDTHHNFQRRVATCQRIVSSLSYVRGLSKYESLQTGRLKQDLNDIVLCYSKLQKQISTCERGVIKRSRTSSSRSSLNEVGLQEQEQEHMWLDGQEILEREQHIKRIEDDMVGVADIMKQISYMVHDQGKEVDNIEAHVIASNYTVTEATSLLHKAEGYQQKRRKRLTCISITLLVIVIVVVLSIVLVIETR